MEVQEKEAILRKFTKQSRTVNQIKRGDWELITHFIIILFIKYIYIFIDLYLLYMFMCIYIYHFHLCNYVLMLRLVSQLVTEEFTEMSQKLEIEQGLRHHAEEFAHQVVLFLFTQ